MGLTGFDLLSASHSTACTVMLSASQSALSGKAKLDSWILNRALHCTPGIALCEAALSILPMPRQGLCISPGLPDRGAGGQRGQGTHQPAPGCSARDFLKLRTRHCRQRTREHFFPAHCDAGVAVCALQPTSCLCQFTQQGLTTFPAPSYA